MFNFIKRLFCSVDHDKYLDGAHSCVKHGYYRDLDIIDCPECKKVLWKKKPFLSVKEVRKALKDMDNDL